ncbi:MAG: FAD-dependent monooxygenase [Alphaproteobacteria bacterium]|nr:FAD-dependent monooxygenase [Alphaproteobacteria bacterium]
MTKPSMTDCLIIGAGPTALAMARALQIRGVTMALCGTLPPQDPSVPDMRTAALFLGSIRLLERLDAWQHARPSAEPIRAIRIVDSTGRLLRAPEQTFTATAVHEDAIAFNVPNPALVDALVKTLDGDLPEERSNIDLGAHVVAVTVEADHVAAELADGTFRRARLAIAADGRRSITREAAAISCRTWDHGQAAITAHIDHELPHQGVSTEIHMRTGPCTVVPLSGNRSSLVWMDERSAASERAALSDAQFIRTLESCLEGLLGPIQTTTPRRIFPLSMLLAERFAGNRVALIGETGHAFPPIGAQGLNLGLRDVASLADHLADAKAAGLDPGSPAVLQAYSNDRRGDVLARTYGVDAFNRSLSGRAAGLLRGAILHATKASPAFKTFLLERGMQPVGKWPSMMA